MSVEELEKVVEHVNVYARVSPEHKLNIVQALQKHGHIVAMTGDGVNDAPALNKADIGVAMGITGTDVAKEASDIVLLDDNFATIVAAVEEGRWIFDNIRKFIKYTMTSNAGEIWVMLLAPFIGMPFPLLPLQILWINLVTDGLPGLALAIEPAERKIMQREPFNPRENIFGRGMARDILWVGLLMGFVSLGVGYWYWSIGHPQWQTMVFTTLTLSQMGNALAIRSQRDSLFQIGLLSNRAMLGAVLLTFVLQMVVVYVPFFQSIFETGPLSLRDLLISLALSTAVFWGVEIQKWFIRRSEERQNPSNIIRA
jgi:Ca2+-transporting ATPase